jgi:hypothetical protein
VNLHRLVPRRFRHGSQSWPLACGLATASFLTFLAAIPEIFVPDTALGWVDAWYYVGLAQQLPESMRQHSSSLYQAERLAWTLPGYLFNQVAPPLAANYILKGVYFAATVFFLFGALRQICGLRTAAFVSALASLYSFVAHSLGANHIDGAANTYFLMAVYGANRAALGERFGAHGAFVAGVAYVAVLFTQFAFILVLPLFAGYVLLTRAQTDRQKRLAHAVLLTSFLAGAATAWIAAGAVYAYWEIPGRPLQLQFDLVSRNNPNSFVAPDGPGWLLIAYWLLLPAAVVAWIVPTVVDASTAGWKAALRLPPAYWLFLSVSGLWIAMHFVNAPWIMLPFYASFLIPVTFLALGPAVVPLVERLSWRSYWWLLGLLFVGAFAAYRLNNSRFAAAAAVAAIVCLTVATLQRAANRLSADRRASVVLTLLVLALVAIDFATADYTVQVRNSYKYTAMAQIYHAPGPESQWPASRGDAFAGAVNAAKALAPRLSGKHYYFWYSGDDRLGMFFRSVGSMFYVWSTHDLLDERFEGINEDTIKWLMPQPGGRVRDLLILTRSADVRVRDSPLDLHWTEAFSTAGTRYYAHYFVVDMVRAAGFEPTPRRIGLASRFPCSLERAAAAQWYDRAIHTTRSRADLDALLPLFTAEHTGPIQCLSVYRKLTQGLAAAEHASPYVPSTTSCEPELAIAEVYLAEVFDDPLRQEALPKLEAARAAQNERQIELCRVAVGDIRRAYFEAIYGSNDASAAASRLRLAAIGVDFEPTPRRIRLASRFPCNLERPSAALWYDRAPSRTSAERMALEELFRAEHKGPIQCLSAYNRLAQRLGAAERRSVYLPATGTCESELAIAEVYLSEVFDDPLRQETIHRLDAARGARKAQQTESCRLAVGDIRRAYFEAVYGSY